MESISAHLSRPNYRPDIDGLRAIGILSIISFHAFPDKLSGGFLGVDIFFVISGYLISTIILNTLDLGTFSFVEFYKRRINRIFPALILILATCLVFGWFALLANEYKQLGKHIAGAAGGISNFIFWKEAGYFDNAAETKPLLHLWSLGIEEQFYIFWPIFLWIAKKNKINIFLIIIIITSASFYLNIKGIHNDTISTFYSPQTRFWELICGSLLAWWNLYNHIPLIYIKKKYGYLLNTIVSRHILKSNYNALLNAQSLFGLLLLCYGSYTISKEMLFPGALALIPVLGTVLIISAGEQAWFNRVVLSSRVLVWLGLISFPLYLWHWPILSFIQIIDNKAPSNTIRATAILLSIMLAWITYLFIEKPIRFNKTKNKINSTVIISLIITTGYMGYYTYKNDGFYFRVNGFESISKASGEWEYPGALKIFYYKNRTLFYQKSERSETTLFVGDSNVEQYYVRMDELIKNNPFGTNSIIFVTGGGCLPIRNSPYDDPHKHCSGLMDSAFDLASSEKNISTIVIAGMWNPYLAVGDALTVKFGHGSRPYNEALSNLSLYIRDLIKLNKKIVLVLSTPFGHELDPKNMVLRGIEHFPRFFTLRVGGISKKNLEDEYGLIQNDLRRIAEESGALVINPLDYLCNADKCLSVDAQGEPMYKDAGHLRPKFVRNSVEYLDFTVTSY